MATEIIYGWLCELSGVHKNLDLMVPNSILILLDDLLSVHMYKKKKLRSPLCVLFGSANLFAVID